MCRLQEWQSRRNRLLDRNFGRFIGIVIVIFRYTRPGDRLRIPDLFFHIFAWLKRHDVLGFNIHWLVRAWVACPTGFTPFHLKNAEFSQFDAAIGGKCFDDRIERHLHDPLDLELGQTGLIGYLFDDFFLSHGEVPRAASQAVPTLIRSLKSSHRNG